MYAALLQKLGTTSGGYVELLDDAAQYLGQLPSGGSSGLGLLHAEFVGALVTPPSHDISDIGKLWSFAVAQTENLWPLPSPPPSPAAETGRPG